jgi:hypothetical protein
VPLPLGEVVAWLDDTGALDDGHRLTTDAAEAIGWDAEKLGKALPVQGVPTGKTRDPAGYGRRRGFRAGDARNAAR